MGVQDIDLIFKFRSYVVPFGANPKSLAVFRDLNNASFLVGCISVGGISFSLSLLLSLQVFAHKSSWPQQEGHLTSPCNPLSGGFSAPKLLWSA